MYDRLPNNEDTPQQIISVYRRKNILIINNELYELNKPGFCRDGEDKEGKYKVCIREIISHLVLNPNLYQDSVYVFEKQLYSPSSDSAATWLYISAKDNLIVRKEKRDKHGKVLTREELSILEVR